MIPLNQDPRGAPPLCPLNRHSGPNSIRPCLIGGRGDDTSRKRSAHGRRLSFERRVISLFHGDEKCIHINVENNSSAHRSSELGVMSSESYLRTPNSIAPNYLHFPEYPDDLSYDGDPFFSPFHHDRLNVGIRGLQTDQVSGARESQH